MNFINDLIEAVREGRYPKHLAYLLAVGVIGAIVVLFLTIICIILENHALAYVVIGIAVLSLCVNGYVIYKNTQRLKRLTKEIKELMND